MNSRMRCLALALALGFSPLAVEALDIPDCDAFVRWSEIEGDPVPFSARTSLPAPFGDTHMSDYFGKTLMELSGDELQTLSRAVGKCRDERMRARDIPGMSAFQSAQSVVAKGREAMRLEASTRRIMLRYYDHARDQPQAEVARRLALLAEGPLTEGGLDYAEPEEASAPYVLAIRQSARDIRLSDISALRAEIAALAEDVAARACAQGDC